MSDVVHIDHFRAPQSLDSFATPADLSPRRPRALEMGCHLPEAMPDERPGVPLGVLAWACGSVIGALLVGAICALALI